MADSKLPALTEVSVPDLSDPTYLVDVSDTTDDPTGSSRKLSLSRLLGLGGFEPGGRLTLTSGVPVTTSDVTGAGTLYYTPFLHNRVRVWDGTRWLYKTFSEISLALTLTSGKNYDVFLDDDAATLVLSAAWTNDTTRADALGTQDSVEVLNSDKTKLWLGTIRASAANQTTDSGAPATGTTAKRFVWNRYNRVLRPMSAIEDADSWTYTTATWRSMNGDDTNRCEYVVGKSLEAVTARTLAHGSNSGSEWIASGVGVDATNANSARVTGASAMSSSFVVPFGAIYSGFPGIGYRFLQAIEISAASGTTTWYGDVGLSYPSAGIAAEVWG